MIVALLLVMLGQSAPRGVTLTGVVQDQTGAVLPGAHLTITVSGSTTLAQDATADGNGAFRFERLPPGTYDLRTEFPGFTANMAHLRVTTRAPSSITIVMQIAGVTQEVSVNGRDAGTATAAAANLNTIAIDSDTRTICRCLIKTSSVPCRGSLIRRPSGRTV